jgi:hypothetical protein
MNSKVYGRGDMYTRKHATPSQEQRYQNVLSIAVYHTAQVLGLPQAPESGVPAREDANDWAAPGGALSRLPCGLGRSET